MVAYDMCSLVDEVTKPIDSYGKVKDAKCQIKTYIINSTRHRPSV